MTSPHLHIVSFDVPYPPDYGGAMDIYYRLVALKELGYQFTLHCYQYRRPPAPELSSICAQVYYYKRPLYWHLFSFHRPYIVASRCSSLLLQRLWEDEDPILFEGLHTTAFLAHPSLSRRMKVVRMHNIEHLYYAELAKRETRFLHRIYYLIESVRLKHFEKILIHAQGIAAISETEERELREGYGSSVFLLPAAHPFHECTSLPGQGAYALYHSNLAISENHQAALFLVNDVFKEQTIPLIIAGKAPRQELMEAVKKRPDIRIIADPGLEEMSSLIQQAHIQLLPGWQVAGLKLKLLISFFQGRHLVCSPAMIEGTGLEEYCLLAETPEQWRKQIGTIMDTPFTKAGQEKRSVLLHQKWETNQHTKELCQFMGILKDI